MGMMDSYLKHIIQLKIKVRAVKESLGDLSCQADTGSYSKLENSTVVARDSCCGIDK